MFPSPQVLWGGFAVGVVCRYYHCGIQQVMFNLSILGSELEEITAIKMEGRVVNLLFIYFVNIAETRTWQLVSALRNNKHEGDLHLDAWPFSLMI